MKNLGSHFVFTRSQQNGIFVLVIIIVVLQLIHFFVPLSSEVSRDPKEEKIVEQMQRSIDSLKQVASRKDSVPPAPFNPNFISDYKGYMLGMSIEEIDRLHAYRQRDLWVNSTEEFQEVTGVSDSLLKSISSSFRFPDFTRRNTKENRAPKETFSSPLSKADLNTASVDDLRQINGIGEKLSARIINYRNSLGGFRGDPQLKDVYGLSPEVIGRLLKKFEVKSSETRKLSLNTASVMQLVEIPYFNYEQARSIVRYREEVGEITSLEELQQVKDFPVDKIDRIDLYLTIDH